MATGQVRTEIDLLNLFKDNTNQNIYPQDVRDFISTMFYSVNAVSNVSSYVYIGYADDAFGTGFTLIFNPSKTHIAIRNTNTPIVSPSQGDFSNMWTNYIGAAGVQGLSMLTGLVNPLSSDGVDGDMFLNVNTYDIFGPKSAGIWGSGTTIVGKGINSLVLLSTTLNVDTYRITYNDTTTFDYNVTNGRGITQIQNNGLGYTYTFNDGTTSFVGYPTIGSFYAAWADDNLGTNISMTPADKKYLALIDNIAGSNPVSSDFTGKFFSINTAEKAFKNSSFLNNSHLTTTPGIEEFFQNVIVLPVIPYDFIKNQGASFEFEFEWQVSPNVNTLNTHHYIKGNLNGSIFLTGILDLTSYQHVKTVVKGVMKSATSASCMVTTHVTNAGGSSITTKPEGFSYYLNNLIITTDLTCSLTSIITVVGAPVTYFYGSYAEAYNPSKTTI